MRGRPFSVVRCAVVLVVGWGANSSSMAVSSEIDAFIRMKGVFSAETVDLAGLSLKK